MYAAKTKKKREKERSKIMSNSSRRRSGGVTQFGTKNLERATFSDDVTKAAPKSDRSGSQYRIAFSHSESRLHGARVTRSHPRG